MKTSGIIVSIDRGRLRWFVVFVATVAAVISFFVAVRSHNTLIKTNSKLCVTADIFQKFLESESNHLADQIQIRKEFPAQAKALSANLARSDADHQVFLKHLSAQLHHEAHC